MACGLSVFAGIKIFGGAFGAFPKNSGVRIFFKEKRQKIVKALSNLKIRYLLSLQTGARAGTIAMACLGLIGTPALAGSDYVESGTHPSVGHYSADLMSHPSMQIYSIGMTAVNAIPVSAPENDFPMLELADLGDGGDDSSSEYVMQVQLAQASDDANDPLEGFNRAIFGFNEFIYSGVLGPVADVYNVLPREARTMVSSFLSNLSEPIVFINDLLQGELVRAMNTFTRFSMNSIFGFGGLADVASSAGIESHDEDFGQTLAVWGVGEGFYLVLPLLGPSSPRDAIGQLVVDPMMDPVNIYLDNHDDDDWIIPRAAAAGFRDFASIRDELVKLEKNSIDYYAAIRSLYRQKRAIEISNGSDTDLPAIPDFDFSDFPELDGPAPALGDVKDPNTDEDDEISALTQAAFVDDASMHLDPFEPRFSPEIRYTHEDAATGDEMMLERTWHAQVISATSPAR